MRNIIKKPLYKTAVLLVVFLIQACSNQAQRVYEESSYGVPLEVPPDLTKPSAQQDDLSFFTGKDKAAEKKPNQAGCDCSGDITSLPVIPEQKDIILKRDGARRWLVLQGEPRNIWPWVRDFWLKSGFKINLEDPVIGLVETDWKQQRNNLPLAGSDGKGKVAVGQEVLDQAGSETKIYAVPELEKYRVRLEKGEQPGTTELFLTHRGVELLAQDKMIVWKLRETDLELESEMLQRLMVFFNQEQQNIGAPLASRNQLLNIASLIKNEKGHATLKVDVEFIRLWRRIGLVLDRMNYIIENSDRAVGTYFLRVKDPLKDDDAKEEKGWFASLFSDDEDKEATRIRVILKDEGESTHINVHNKDGELLNDEEAGKILGEMINHLQ